MKKVVSEQETVRREALKKLRALGVNPYPAKLFPVDNYSMQIKENYNEIIKYTYIPLLQQTYRSLV